VLMLYETYIRLKILSENVLSLTHNLLELLFHTPILKMCTKKIIKTFEEFDKEEIMTEIKRL